MRCICFVLFVCSFLHFIPTLSAQDNDSLAKTLSTVVVEARARKDISRMSVVSGAFLIAGKKNDVIHLPSLDASLAEKIPRQIFAKTPGVVVYDLEGSNQLNISVRGLDPHRGWEFNLRKDGILTNSDLYAYPASHFSLPMEAIEKIEFIRGTASLQYGPQYGGMINFITKKGDTTKPFSLESYNTAGSFRLLSTYNAVGGKTGKWTYYAFVNKRTRKGYRQNEESDYRAGGIRVSYTPESRLEIHLDYATTGYVYRIPGPLNDSMFKANPRQATRFRNYYSPYIHLPSVSLIWKMSEKQILQWSAGFLTGYRNSVLFDRPATIPDTFNLSILNYNPRQVDIDRYRSLTTELRWLRHYQIGEKKNVLAAGMQTLYNRMYRKQQGRGTSGFDYDISLTHPVWGRDLRVETRNISWFAENSFYLNEKFSIQAGVRLENGESRLRGNIVYYPEHEIPVSVKRFYLLKGAGFVYNLFKGSELYGSFAETYRPVLFKDIIPASVFEKVDPEIKDGKGSNLEIGFRGQNQTWQWDITAFRLFTRNRFGTLSRTDNIGNFYTWRTNTGDAATYGLEIFIQITKRLGGTSRLSLFTATALMEARYLRGEIKSGHQNVSIKNKIQEGVPRIITRNGATFQLSSLSVTLLMSHTGKHFADPLNTEKPNLNGTIGLVPSYTLWDINLSWPVTKFLEGKLALNNITDKQYFTKRPVFYPGPGVWPSDGRNFNISLIFRM
ncbi:MAG: TonB-dependent receptor [Chitinophagaceae bacterium]|nr:TonB-dependent receptor [Chitinophagaceae bacterium]